MAPAWVADYIGLPFRDHGRDRRGLDCWGLVRLVLAEQFGVSLIDFDYASTRDSDGIPAAIEAARPEWSVVGDPQLGDVMVFNIGGQPMHVGLVIETGLMLHVSDDDRGAVMESYLTPAWRPRMEGIYRYER